MRLAYTAYDGSGKTVTGVLDAGDVMAATDILRRKGLFVAEVNAAAAARAVGHRRRGKRWVSGRQRLKNVAWFSRQLYVLVSSGTQVADALHALERQTRPGPWREVIGGLKTRVEEGASLAAAMEPHHAYFDPVYRNLIAAGESSGHLQEMLDRLAAFKQKQLRVRNAIAGALVYPCMLTALGLNMLIVLLLVIVPRFAGLFQTLDAPLPASTAVLIAVSTAFRRYWWLLLLSVAGMIVALVAYLRTPRGILLRDTIVLRLPCLGRVVRRFATARIVSLLGVLMQARIPILEALKLVRYATGNVHYERLISKAENCVMKGEPICTAFGDSGLIDLSVHEAIRSGEQSGEIDQLLLTIAGFLDEENEVILRSLTSLIEPVILIAMGLLVGLISVCMFMPLFDLTSIAQGGGG